VADTGKEAVPSPLDRVTEVLAEYMRLVNPKVTSCRIVGYTDDADEVANIKIELPCIELTEQHQRILSFLNGFNSGVWVQGKTIAAQVDLVENGGQFRKLLRELKRMNRIESSANGYRVVKPKLS
jgi:hypothetical protein